MSHINNQRDRHRLFQLGSDEILQAVRRGGGKQNGRER